uniref:SAC domain-containing protein n=1 Tax=Aureoumbra lagunensis TaxID=44058 RepID=A0A7S3NGC4_9STRA
MSEEEIVYEKARYVRWHGDGLIFEAEDLARLSITRRAGEVGAYDVHVGKSAPLPEPSAPVIEIEGIYGIYELMSGPYIALVMESAPIFPALYGESEIGATSLRKVVKIGLAPLYIHGRRRLNSKEQADEALVLRLLTNALQSLPLVYSRQTPTAATHSQQAFQRSQDVSRIRKLAAARKIEQGFDDQDDDDSVPDEDDEEESLSSFYLFDKWDEKFLWNRVPLDKILQSIANMNAQDTALAWCLRCAVAQTGSIANDKALVISRLARYNVAGTHRIDQPTLPLDFIETEIIIPKASLSYLCARAGLFSQVDILENVIQNLVLEYGGHFVTLVELCRHQNVDLQWKNACAQLASLTRGAKLRHLVLDAKPITTSSISEIGQLITALSSPTKQNNFFSDESNTQEELEAVLALTSPQAIKKKRRLRSGLVLFLGQDDDVDTAIIACALETLHISISPNQFQRDWPGVQKLRHVLGQNLKLGFFSCLKSALFQGPLNDGLDLVLASRSPGLENLFAGKKQVNKPKILIRTDSSISNRVTTKHRFIPAQIPVYPLDLVDLVAFKVMFFLFIIFIVISHYAPHTSFSSRFSCSLLILVQTLGLLLANSIFDHSLFTDLASCRRFATPAGPSALFRQRRF